MKIQYLDMFSIVVYRIGFPDRPLLLLFLLFFVFKYKKVSNVVFSCDLFCACGYIAWFACFVYKYFYVTVL